MRGDAEAVERLLSAGANPNRSNNRKSTPLHAAATSESPHCVELLLLSGADPTRKDAWGYQPLHFACSYQDDISFVKLLILSRAPLDTENNGGSTPLIKALVHHNYRIGLYLMDRGANINARDQDGDSPLFEAIHWKSHRMLEGLLQRGADCFNVNFEGQTLVHKAALCATPEALEILSSSTMPSLDRIAKNKFGQAAEDLFDSRLDKPVELEKAFRQFLDKKTKVELC